MNPQSKIAQLVTDRGCREGWTAEQFAARQVLKLTEELAGLFRWFNFLSAEAHRLRSRMIAPIGIGYQAKHAGHTLEDEGHGRMAIYDNIRPAKEELADIQIIVFCLAEALGEYEGKPFDIVRAALDRAAEAVERRIR